jgi:hypothetical protein
MNDTARHILTARRTGRTPHAGGYLPGSARLVIELGCQNSDCPVREITFRLKDYNVTLASLLRSPVTCPICHTSELALHSVRTFKEVEDDWDRRARACVNGQMWARDHSLDPAFPVYDMARACDERLPPTPPGWWEEEGP